MSFVSIKASVFVLITAVVIAGVLLLLPRFLQSSLPKKGNGYAAPGWNKVAEVFKRHVETGQQRGGGFVVVHKGEIVMEFFGGYADYDAEVEWKKDTLSGFYSATTGVGAIVIAVLADRGLIKYKAPVAKYWPEFAKHGKEKITVEQLLSHQAGLVLLDEKYSLYDLATRPDQLGERLAAAKPLWQPGTAHGSHSITLGLFMDQLVRRVDPQHRSLDRFFADEIARPFGLDMYIGLPKEENYRCARSHRFSVWDVLLAPAYWREFYTFLFQTDSLIRKLSENFEEGGRNLDNNPTYREIPCASTHGFGTVASLASLYGILANGGDHNGKKLLSESAIQKLNDPLVTGLDSVYLVNTTFSRGTAILDSPEHENIFGHPGFGGQMGAADLRHHLAWAYLTNYHSVFSSGDDTLYVNLVDAMYESVIQVERQKD